MNILLVEDHGATAKMIRVVLSEKGHTVETAGDVSTALELADRYTFELLVSDLGLPDGSGYDLLRQLRMRGHKFPAIALSGYGHEDDVRRSHKAGFVAHLTKPASREAVIQAVASAMAEAEPTKMHESRMHPAEPSVFDFDAALKRCLGQREILFDMIASFHTDSTEQLTKMHAALDKAELAEIGRAAHTLRGSLVYLEAQPAADAAAKVEQAAKSANVTAAAKAITELERQVELLKQVLFSEAVL